MLSGLAVQVVPRSPSIAASAEARTSGTAVDEPVMFTGSPCWRRTRRSARPRGTAVTEASNAASAGERHDAVEAGALLGRMEPLLARTGRRRPLPHSRCDSHAGPGGAPATVSPQPSREAPAHELAAHLSPPPTTPRPARSVACALHWRPPPGSTQVCAGGTGTWPSYLAPSRQLLARPFSVTTRTPCGRPLLRGSRPASEIDVGVSRSTCHHAPPPRHRTPADTHDLPGLVHCRQGLLTGTAPSPGVGVGGGRGGRDVCCADEARGRVDPADRLPARGSRRRGCRERRRSPGGDDRGVAVVDAGEGALARAAARR